MLPSQYKNICLIFLMQMHSVHYEECFVRKINKRRMLMKKSSLKRGCLLGVISMISLLSGCADGALGMRGSPAWYLTASQADIDKYEKNGGSRSSSIRQRKPVSKPSSSSIIGNRGSSYQRIGNTVFGSDGTTHQQIGNTVFSSDGTTHQRIGNTVFSSDGNTHQQIGNTVFSSDGTTHQRI